MGEAAQEPEPHDYVAARVILNMFAASAHDTRAQISMKTGIEMARVQEIFTGQSYPDLYEIAQFERAYHRPIWPTREP